MQFVLEKLESKSHFQDENENIFLSISCFETRTRNRKWILLRGYRGGVKEKNCSESKTGQLLFFFDWLLQLWNLQWFSILEKDKGNRIRFDYSLVEEFVKVQNVLRLLFITKRALPPKISIASLLCVNSQVTFKRPFPQPFNVPVIAVKMLFRQCGMFLKLWQWVLVLVT